jgi:hypothetical protein
MNRFDALRLESNRTFLTCTFLNKHLGESRGSVRGDGTG